MSPAAKQTKSKNIAGGSAGKERGGRTTAVRRDGNGRVLVPKSLLSTSPRHASPRRIVVRNAKINTKTVSFLFHRILRVESLNATKTEALSNQHDCRTQPNKDNQPTKQTNKQNYPKPPDRAAYISNAKTNAAYLLFASSEEAASTTTTPNGNSSGSSLHGPRRDMRIVVVVVVVES